MDLFNLPRKRSNNYLHPVLVSTWLNGPDTCRHQKREREREGEGEGEGEGERKREIFEVVK